MEIEPPEQAVTGRRSIARQHDAVHIGAPNIDRYCLCAELKRKQMTPTIMRIRAKSPAGIGGLERRPGEEYAHVLQGSIAVHTEFYDTVTVHAGEGIYIDSNMARAYVAAENCDEAIVLGVSWHCRNGDCPTNDLRGLSPGLTTEQVHVTASPCPKTLLRNAPGAADSAACPPS
jgi:hypothetical protein